MFGEISKRGKGRASSLSFSQPCRCRVSIKQIITDLLISVKLFKSQNASKKHLSIYKWFFFWEIPLTLSRIPGLQDCYCGVPDLFLHFPLHCYLFFSACLGLSLCFCKTYKTRVNFLISSSSFHKEGQNTSNWISKLNRTDPLVELFKLWSQVRLT